MQTNREDKVRFMCIDGQVLLIRKYKARTNARNQAILRFQHTSALPTVSDKLKLGSISMPLPSHSHLR